MGFADERRWWWYRIGSSGRVAHGEPPVDSTFGRDAEAKGNKLHSGVQRLRLLASPSRGLAGLSLCLLAPSPSLHPSSRFIRAPFVTLTQPRIVPHSTFTSNLPLEREFDWATQPLLMLFNFQTLPLPSRRNKCASK